MIMENNVFDDLTNDELIIIDGGIVDPGDSNTGGLWGWFCRLFIIF